MNGLFERITNLRFSAFLVVAVSAFILCVFGRLSGGEWAAIMTADVAAFIGASAWADTFSKAGD